MGSTASGAGGIELMQGIRSVADLPVIFSGYGHDEIIAGSFDAGADDYAVKPFSPTELPARIRVALRQRAVPERLESYELGDLSINFAQRRVTLAGRPVQLPAI